jgi:16S rRNA (cytosine1402-N4)-methyltransferase
VARVHQPVLLDEVLELLDLEAGQVVVDGTVGAAGHASAMARKVVPGGFLLGLDQDPQVAELAARELISAGFTREEQFDVEVRRFSQFDEALASRRISGFDRLLLDLGVNSLHLDMAERGFSMKRDGPLDMRMNPDDPGRRSAAEVVASEDVSTLVKIFEKYGEERFARRIARVIVDSRDEEPIRTTAQLRELVAKAIPRRAWPANIDPATRVFQALRIEVNRELDELDEVLGKLPGMARPGARIAIISFHSLEDRRVKEAFRSWCRGCICPPDFPVCMCGRKPQFRPITTKAVVAGEAEVQANPRARSAKLRVVEKLPQA